MASKEGEQRSYGPMVDEVCTEEMLLNLVSLYGKIKTAAEQYLCVDGYYSDPVRLIIGTCR